MKRICVVVAATLAAVCAIGPLFGDAEASAEPRYVVRKLTDMKRPLEEPRPWGTIGGKVLFDSTPSSGVDRLHVTDGTQSGTHALRSSPKIPNSSDLFVRQPEIARVKHGFVFDGVRSGSSALWFTDGTSRGTHRLTGPLGDEYSGLEELKRFGPGRVLFFSRSEQQGYRLWETDGTRRGTKVIGPFGTSMGAYHLRPFRDRLFFIDHGYPSGVALASPSLRRSSAVDFEDEPNPSYDSPFPFEVCGDDVYAAFNSNETDSESLFVVRVDGTSKKIAEIPRGFLGGIYFMLGYEGRCYFNVEYREDAQVGTDDEYGEIWVSDGTIGGTKPLATDIQPNYYGLREIWGDEIYYDDYDASHGTELWRMHLDGSGKQLVADVNPGSANSNPNGQPMPFDGHLYFGGVTQSHGYSLFRTKGTPESTRRITQLPDDGGPLYLHPFSSGLYFSSYSPDDGYQLYVIKRRAGRAS